MTSLKDAVVVVTGASAGIGRATALAFADRGSAVALVARRQDVLEDVADECRAKGVDALVLPADVADAEAMDEVAAEVAGRFGRIDVWVNNAGVSLFGRLEETPLNAWYRVIETNLFGVFHGMRAALPWMREQGSGVIINVSSMLGKITAPYSSSYVASKHGVLALSDSARQELLDVPDIKVCTVLPGSIDTSLFTEAGNYTGREIKPPTPVIPAERVAAAIVRCAARPQREVAVGVSTSVSLGLNRLIPGGTRRAAAKRLDDDFFRDVLEQPNPGKIFEPLEDGEAGVSGGWARTGAKVGSDSARAASGGRSVRRSRWATLGVAAVVGAGVAGAAVRNRRS